MLDIAIEERHGPGITPVTAPAPPPIPGVNIHPGMVKYQEGVKLFEAAEYDLAITAFQDALTMLPGLVPAWVNLGNCYEKKKMYGPAIANYETAVALEPLLGEAYNNIATAYQKMDLIATAKGVTEIATSLLPHDSRIRWNRSVFNLTLGLLAKGWDDYDYRFWKPGAASKKRVAPPSYWQGEDLRGRSILIWSEQGLGEIILYSSMVRECVGMAGHVTIETAAKMVPVFKQSFPWATVLAYGEADTKKFDYQLPMGSLGRFCRRAWADFPRHLGYLAVNLAVRQQVRKNFLEAANGRPVIGVSWTSSNDFMGPGKSMALTDLMPILTKDYCFVSLQYGECQAELQAVRDLGVPIHEITNCGASMEEFFAVVDACDLVITTSSTTAHTAGAINVPVWVMLPRGESRLWHWHLLRRDSPWYPSARLFRQKSVPAPNLDWFKEVVADVARALP